MPTRIIRGRLTGWRLLSISLAAALPFLVMLPLAYYESERQAQAQANAANEIVLRQAESILNQAANLSATLTTLAGQPCAQVKEQLQRIGTFRPYFRALGVGQGRVG